VTLLVYITKTHYLVYLYK